MKSCFERHYFSSSLLRLPCRKAGFYSFFHIHFSLCLELSIFFLSLSKSAHTFVFRPTHFPLSFLYPPPLRLPSPHPPFLLASAFGGLSKGCTTRATPFLTASTPPLSHSAQWYDPALHKFPPLVWRPVLKELLVPFERFGCMCREKASAPLLYAIIT